MKRREIADRTQKLPENFNPMMGSIGMHDCAMSHFALDLRVTIEEMLDCRQEMQELEDEMISQRQFRSVWRGTHNMLVL